MATIGTLNVNILLNNAQFLTQINRTTQATNRAMQQMQRSVGNLDRAFLVLRRTFLSFFAFSSITRAVRDVANYADAWKLATNQVAAANAISTHQARSMQGINVIASRTRTSLADTAELYGKLLRSTNDVAKSEEEVARATELVNKAFKAGGASMQEQVNGIRQLAQSLASGIFQGDELRSIRENAPLLAQAIAEEFNTTIGGLKKLGAEGQLTADRVFKAILKNSKPIEDAFDATNATIAESFTLLDNALTQYIGEVDKSTGASVSFNNAIKGVAANLKEMSRQQALTSTQIGTWDNLKAIFLIVGEEVVKVTRKIGDLARENIRLNDQQGAVSGFWQNYIYWLKRFSDPAGEAAKFIEKIRKRLDELRGNVEVFALSNARTGLGRANIQPTFGGRGFEGPGLGDVAETTAQREAIITWRESVAGAAGDMQRLTEAASQGQKALDLMTDQIAAENAVIKLGEDPRTEYGKWLVDFYTRAKAAERAQADLTKSFEETESLERQIGQERLLQEALTKGSKAYRDLMIHIEALNEATAAGINLSEEEFQKRVALTEVLARQREETERLVQPMQEVADTINSTVSSAISSVASSFADAIVEGESFREMLDNLLKDLAKLAINQVFQLFLKQMIGQVGGPGGTGSGLLGVTGLHSGGIVGSRIGGRSAPAAMFAGAPRLHGGGAFFGGSEFPAILKRGEGVFTQDQMKALGSGTTNNFTVINQVPNTSVTEERQQNASGGTDVTAYIRQTMTKEIGDPGSSVHKQLKTQFGLSQAGIRR